MLTCLRKYKKMLIHSKLYDYLQGALQILDWYNALFIVIIVCILECIVIVWTYGNHRVYLNMSARFSRLQVEPLPMAVR